LHARPQDLQRYVRGQLSPAELSDLEAHIVECEACQRSLAELSASQPWDGSERRSEPRTETEFETRLKVLNPISSTGASVKASVIGVSTKGVKLRVETAVMVGAMVQIRLKESLALAEVRYCNEAGDEFHVGLRLLESFPMA
jgi:anti-sigma factor RsiW